MNLLAEWGALFNQTQELDPFLMTVLRPKHVHDLASEHIHRGEQSSRSVALIIVGLSRTMAGNLANPYVLGTTNYQEVRFPGDLRDCTACHLAGTYLVENVGAKAAVASTGAFTKTTPPISAACQGCHDDVATASHALANTTVLGESCAACHKAGEAASVDRGAAL